MKMVSFYITYYLFNILDELSHRTNHLSNTPRVQDKMAGKTSSVEEFLADFPTLILPKIGKDPTREAMIELHWLISGNAVSMALNLGGIRQGHLTITMTKKDYMTQTENVFVPPHNPSYFLTTMSTAQQQALRTGRF